jgi:hypothetical protein
MQKAIVFVILVFQVAWASGYARSVDEGQSADSDQQTIVPEATTSEAVAPDGTATEGIAPDLVELEASDPQAIESDDDGEWHPVETDPAPRVGQPRVLTAEQQALRDRIRRCLAHYFYNPETTSRRSPWGVMHAVVGFGVDTPLIASGKQVNAISWLCANAPCLGMQMLYGQNGQLGVRMGAGQLLCILAQSRVKIDYPLVINGRQMTVADLVRHEQDTCRAHTELTFKLIGLSYYLDPDATWKNLAGEQWDIQRILREELAQPIAGAACGGTHRLTGFSYAVCKRETSGKPMTGQWKRAQKFLDEFHEHAFKVQNADGSFSTQWFVQRSDYGNLNRKLNTTGHILEWLVYSLSEPQLTDARTVRAVEYLTNLLWQYRGYDWEIGPKGHAIHALSLYDERLFGGKLGERDVQLAQARDAANQDENPIASYSEPAFHSEDRSAVAPRNVPPRRRRRFR